VSDAKPAYWIIESDEAKALFASLIEKHKAASTASAALSREYGGTGRYFTRGPHLMGFEFETPPDKKVWKNIGPKVWGPRRNTKAGIAIWERMAKLKRLDSDEIGNVFLGAALVFSDMHIHHPGWATIGGQTVILGIEHKEWKPIDGLRRIKASEYWAMREKSDAAMEALATV
jgi:hypothetical protein